MSAKDPKQKGKYADTVRLPETPFPMKADLATREPGFIKGWNESKLYERILADRAGDSPFVLHDGPPYSNGHLHYGHILNKTLKDLVIRSRTMMGHRAPYIPGWDTHGLPIELAVERELKDKRAGMSGADVRRACRDYALKYVDIQREEFKRLGILGQWDEPYLTLDPGYEQAIVEALAAFARGGYLYRGKKPVYWCTHDRTALAEAEIEYEDKTSPSIYVRFPLVDFDASKLGLPAGAKIALPIWTTTPWTLPANLAIVLHPDLEYVAIAREGEILVVASALAESFLKAIGADPTTARVTIAKAALRALEGAHYTHPFVPSKTPADHRVWFATYVTTEAGTGLVHTAPGHGADDFATGNAHGLEPYAPVDDAGMFTADVPHWGGMHTLKANTNIVQWLHDHGALLNQPGETIRHSYPHCWRCKHPILFRATPQWFIKMDHPAPAEATLRARALDAIDHHVTWIPSWGQDRIHGMIENRPDWVLSRQRLWGTPIPAFYCRECNAPHAEADTMEHVARLFGKEGADAWWTHSVAELVPPGTTCAGCGADAASSFEREKDIVDVWFESGVSWKAMAARDPSHAHIDLYLEGSDQHRGWFHSSLLAGIGVMGRAPYKEVITHGFVVDGATGKPYSKSDIAKAKALGIKISYVEPNDVIAKSGAELFRMWVASTEYRSDIPYSQTILDGLSEWYRKFRNTARFLLGNLGDFDPNAALPDGALRPIDEYMLRVVDDLTARVRAAYAGYDWHVVHRALVDFVSVDLSALYSDVVKDRLYCDPIDAPSRRAAQHVLYACARALATLSAPIMCFTAEDVWQHLPRKAGDPDSVHLVRWPAGAALDAGDPKNVAWAKLLELRADVNRALEPFRAQKHKSVDARVSIKLPVEPLRALGELRGELAELFVVSSVELAEGPALEVGVHEHGGKQCQRCLRWYDVLAVAPDDVCFRCAGALAAIHAS